MFVGGIHSNTLPQQVKVVLVAHMTFQIDYGHHIVSIKFRGK